MTSSADAKDGEYQRFVWRLPAVDPESLLAMAVALHHLFDGVFTGKTWLCRNAEADAPLFSAIELARLTGGSINLGTCRTLATEAGTDRRNTLGDGEHVIICSGAALDVATVTRWRPRTAFAVEPTSNADVVTITYIQRQNGFNDPGFPDILERALRCLVASVRHGADDAADIATLLQPALPAQTMTADAVGSGEDLFIRRFSTIAARAPDRAAIVAGDTIMRYGELARMTDGIALAWRNLGLSKGDRLLLIAPRGPALVATVVAAFKAGLAVCLVDPRQPDAYVAACRRIVQPALVVNLAGRQLDLPEVPVATEVLLDPNTQAPAIDTDCLDGDDCAVITLTSGTTREPKAVAGRYSSLTHFFDWMGDRFGPMADAAFGMCSSIGHDPLQRDIMTPLYLGGRIVIPDEHDLSEPLRLPRWLAANRIEIACLNAALVPWLGETTRLPHLRALFCVGGALTRSQAIALRAAAPVARIVNLYGATETQRAVGFYELPGDREALAALPDVVPLGRGMNDVNLLVRDRAHRRLTLPFQIGEIALNSRYLALGYLGDTELTTRRFRHDVLPEPNDAPTYLTGDLGYVSMRYGVVFAGRMDDQKKISGYRIEPTAIDDVCRQHPEVGNAATLVIDVDGLPTLVTCIVPIRPPGALEGLRHWLAARLPHYMVPHRLCAMDDFPLTLNRKVDTRALAARVYLQIETDAVATRESAMAAAPIDAISAFVFRHTGLEDATRQVPLADLGVDSLRFVELVTQLSSDLGSSEQRIARLHNGMSIVELASALAGEVRRDRRAPAGLQATMQPHTNPRDLLGPVLDVDETRIRFEQGTFDHCCSNSYLGLAGRPGTRIEVAHFLEQSQAHGAHGSAELNGFTSWHEQLAAAIGALHGSEATLLYSSGYMANISAIPSVVEGDAHLFIDESCHQSLVDGCRLSGARISIYRHNDADSLEQLLSKTSRSRAGTHAIVTEGVFSIEGDLLDLPAFHAIARRFECLLIVDEACSLGQIGVDGSGVETHFGLQGSIDVRTGTLAKALGSTGGYATCHAEHASRLRFQRGASFSTSLSPLNAFIALQGAQLMRTEGRALKKRLDHNSAVWRDGLNALGFDTAQSSAAIVPIMCADPDAVASLFRRALELGVYALPVSRPWSRRVNALRTSVTAEHEPDRLREIITRFRSDAANSNWLQ